MSEDADENYTPKNIFLTGGAGMVLNKGCIVNVFFFSLPVVVGKRNDRRVNFLPSQ